MMGSHAWKDFISIKETNPASIGTSAKEALVQARAEEINTVPALGSIASKDDDLSDFAKQILEKIELHKTIENEEIDKDICLLTGYKKLPYIYDCEQERSKLIRLVCRHPTEWNDTPKKADVLKLNDAQKKQIKALSWWDEASGIEGLPQPQNVWHFHPAGFVGNLMGGGCITTEMLHIVCPNFRPDNDFMRHINLYAEEFGICKPLYIAHLLSQLGHESVCFTKTKESLYYSKSRFLELYQNTRTPNGVDFGVYNTYKHLIKNDNEFANWRYGYTNKNSVKVNHRGRGYIQLTWKANYEAYTAYYQGKHHDATKDFVETPDLIEQMPYALESAFYYWDTKCGKSKQVVNSIIKKSGLTMDSPIDKHLGIVKKVTYKVNGGYRGLKDRKDKFKLIFNYLKGK